MRLVRFQSGSSAREVFRSCLPAVGFREKKQVPAFAFFFSTAVVISTSSRFRKGCSPDPHCASQLLPMHRKLRVEDCVSITARDVIQLTTSASKAFLALSNADGSAAVICEISRTGLTTLSINWYGSGTSEQQLELALSRPHFGGLRHWLLCKCRRRTARLFITPASDRLACRVCHRLAYRSNQTWDKRVAFYRRNKQAARLALSDPQLPVRKLLLICRALRLL